MRPKRNQPRYPRTARLNELLREIIAEELREIDDERLEMIAITGVVVDSGLQHAVVYFDTLTGADADADVLAALAEVRGKLKVAIGRQARVKSVPDLDFRPDDVERGAERIEGMLRELNTDD